jgi:peptidoglycan-N-acetylglucosamine deacetylase
VGVSTSTASALRGAASSRTGPLILAIVIALIAGVAMSSRSTSPQATSAGPPVGEVATAVTAVGANDQVPARPPDCSAGTVSLSFDDGPDPVFTPAVLETLRRWDARASFFVIGEKVAQHPEIVRETITQGHAVGNHTWSHPDLTTLSPAEVRTELARTSAAISAAIGESPTTWRPPFGDWDDDVLAEAEDQGMSMVLWDDATDSNDWRGRTPAQIVDVVVGNATDGSTILMHDRLQNTVDALPLVLLGLNEKGLCAR